MDDCRYLLFFSQFARSSLKYIDRFESLGKVTMGARVNLIDVRSETDRTNIWEDRALAILARASLEMMRLINYMGTARLAKV